jgi:hypothetical protein
MQQHYLAAKFDTEHCPKIKITFSYNSRSAPTPTPTGTLAVSRYSTNVPPWRYSASISGTLRWWGRPVNAKVNDDGQGWAMNWRARRKMKQKMLGELGEGLPEKEAAIYLDVPSHFLNQSHRSCVHLEPTLRVCQMEGCQVL